MKTEIKIDPDLGVWTPEYLAESLEKKTDEEFFILYQKDKNSARKLAGIIHQRAADKADTVDQSSPTPTPENYYTPEETEDIDKMHWKAFQAKYGMKPAEFIAKKEGGQDGSIV